MMWPTRAEKSAVISYIKYDTYALEDKYKAMSDEGIAERK
jgi:hypothetical protein